MKRKSKLLGLSTLALAGVLAFTGCGKTEEKKIEKIELVESSGASNKYKVTYTDGSSEIFEEKSQDKELTREEIEEVYTKAVMNSYSENEIFIEIYVLSDDYYDNIKYGFYGEYMEYYEQSPGLKQYHIYSEGSYVSYIDSIEGKFSGKVITNFGYNDHKQSVMGLPATLFGRIENLKAQLVDMVGSDDIDITETYTLQESKYIADIAVTYKNDNLEHILREQLIFSDRVESVNIVSTIESIENGTNNNIFEQHKAVYTYSVDESIKNVDFSTFPEPTN